MHSQASEFQWIRLLERYELGRLPTDLVLIAAKLSESSKKGKPADHLSEAYDLWEAARRLVNEKEREKRKPAKVTKYKWASWNGLPHLFREGNKLDGNETISFKEIGIHGLLPTGRGKKGKELGMSAHLTTRQGIEKALQAFFKAKSPLPEGVSKTSDESRPARRERSGDLLKRVLRDKAMPVDLLCGLYCERMPETVWLLND